jgi:hypothetical protein
MDWLHRPTACLIPLTVDCCNRSTLRASHSGGDQSKRRQIEYVRPLPAERVHDYALRSKSAATIKALLALLLGGKPCCEA